MKIFLAIVLGLALSYVILWNGWSNLYTYIVWYCYVIPREKYIKKYLVKHGWYHPITNSDFDFGIEYDENKWMHNILSKHSVDIFSAYDLTKFYRYELK